MSLEQTEDSIHSYSLQIGQNTPLNSQTSTIQRLVAEREIILNDKRQDNTRWRQYYEPWVPSESNNDPITSVLRIEAKKLSENWLKFRDRLPEDERDAIEGQAPSVESIIEMVEVFSKNWQTKRSKTRTGKFMKYFTNICSTLDSHSVMLEMLPCGSEYVSLLTGSLKTIVAASSNYESISVNLSKAFSIIGDNVSACQREVSMYSTTSMQEQISNMYAHIFILLEDIMQWYLKKRLSRFLNSFKENIYKEYQNQIEIIVNMSNKIRREAELSRGAEIRSTRYTAEQTDEMIRLLHANILDLRIGQENQARQDAEDRHVMRQLLRRQESDLQARRELEENETTRTEHLISGLLAAINGREILISTAQSTFNLRTQHQIRLGRSTIGEVDLSQPPQIESETDYNLYLKDDIAFASRNLENYFERAQILPEILNLTPPSYETSVSSKIIEWTSTSESGMLCVADSTSSRGADQSQSARLAAIYGEYATRFSLPSISYFCELFQDEPLRPDNSRESQALLALTYSLLRQLIEILPPEFESPYDLSEEKFALIDGTLRTWKVTTELLRNLISFIPKKLFCIINGLQILDDKGTEEPLDELVQLLRGSSVPGEHSLKVLFTTEGRSRCLLRTLKESELVFADYERAGSGARRTSGRQRFIVQSRKDDE